MSEPMPVVFNTYAWDALNKPWNGSAQAWINPQGKVYSAQYQTDYRVQNSIWALVLDRKDPKKPAPFVGLLPSNTEVPAELASLLNPDHLFFFMAAAQAWEMPQGELYTTLLNNGAGAALRKIEQLGVYHGCGMTGAYLYTLISVPGSGLPGIEKSTSASYAQSNSKKNESSTVIAKFETLLSMIPGPQGYTPTEIG